MGLKATPIITAAAVARNWDPAGGALPAVRRYGRVMVRDTITIVLIRENDADGEGPYQATARRKTMRRKWRNKLLQLQTALL